MKKYCQVIRVIAHTQVSFHLFRPEQMHLQILENLWLGPGIIQSHGLVGKLARLGLMLGLPFCAQGENICNFHCGLEQGGGLPTCACMCALQCSLLFNLCL